MKRSKRINSKTIIVYAILAIIIMNAAYYGFTHYEGPSVYGDDPNYVYLASSFLQGNYVMNPGYIFSLRAMQFMPIALFFYIFGVHTYSASMWDIFSYLGTIVVVFLFGKFFYNEKAALIGAFVLSVFPLVTKFSVTTGEDPPLMFICSLAVLMLLYGQKFHKPKFYMASGLLLVVAWLISYEAGLIIAFVLVYVLVFLAKDTLHYKHKIIEFIRHNYAKIVRQLHEKRMDLLYNDFKKYYKWVSSKASMFLLFGIIIGLLLTFIFSSFYGHGAAYVTITRNLNFYSKVGGHVNGLPTIPTTNVSLNLYIRDMFPYHIYNTLTTSRTMSEFISNIKNTVFMTPANSEFGLSYYVLILAFIVLAFAREKKATFLVLWFAFMFLFLEFGPMSLGITSLIPLRINYVLSYRLGRFMMITAPAVAAIIGISFARLIEFKRKYLSAIGFVFIMSLLVLMYVNNSMTSNFWYYWQYYPESISIQAGRFIRYDTNALQNGIIVKPVYTEAFSNNAVVPYTGSNMPEYLGDPSTSNLTFEIDNTTNCSVFQPGGYVIWSGPPHCSDWENVFNVTIPKGIPQYFTSYEITQLPYKPTNVYYVK